MAANQTPVFRLNQWISEDPVLREDFNADNRKLENALNSLTNNLKFAGNAYLETGSYVGNGGGKVSLTLSARPLAVMVLGYESLIIPGQPGSGSIFHTANTTPVSFSWSGNTVTWNTPNGEAWCNGKGRTYQYFALRQATA